MLAKLSISNYALIDQLSVAFHQHLNTVTGETGAGKSIILGALGLILGNRADLSVLKDKEKKCIVEGVFQIQAYSLEPFFEKYDLDYDATSILRREISPSGKSRAFVNDTPVHLKTLRELGLQLIDIHSQHQNLDLVNQKYQLELVDIIAQSDALVKKYRGLFLEFQNLKQKLEEKKNEAEKAKADLDYFQFQYTQLEEANLNADEQNELEQELEQLTHAEEIKTALVKVGFLLDDEAFSVIRNLKEGHKTIESIQNYIAEAPELEKRLQSVLLELKDILDETTFLSENVEHNPNRIETINDRLNLIYNLLQKHSVETVDKLIGLRNSFDEKILTAVGYDDEISALSTQVQNQNEKVIESGKKLTKLRKKAFPKIIKSVVADLKLLGMEKAQLTIEHRELDHYGKDGKDAVSFLFSANRDAEPAEISKIASGGEMSRLMLSIKNLLRNSKELPTVIFDEIDSGVSGEIGHKMGNIIKAFSTTTQIINITHLPQIAAKGDTHLQVFKYEKKGKTFTSLKQLSEEERVEELAKMVGGDSLTATTLKTASELLKG